MRLKAARFPETLGRDSVDVASKSVIGLELAGCKELNENQLFIFNSCFVYTFPVAGLAGFPTLLQAKYLFVLAVIDVLPFHSCRVEFCRSSSCSACSF